MANKNSPALTEHTPLVQVAYEGHLKVNQPSMPLAITEPKSSNVMVFSSLSLICTMVCIMMV